MNVLTRTAHIFASHRIDRHDVADPVPSLADGARPSAAETTAVATPRLFGRDQLDPIASAHARVGMGVLARSSRTPRGTRRRRSRTLHRHGESFPPRSSSDLVSDEEVTLNTYAQVLVWTDIADGDVDCETPFLSSLLPPTKLFILLVLLVVNGTAECLVKRRPRRANH